MNCQHFREIYADGSRIIDKSAIDFEDLELHRRSCKECSRFLEGQDTLNRTFREIAERDEKESPSEKTQQALLEAFRNRERLSRTTSSDRYRWLAAAAILILGFSAFVWFPKSILSGKREVRASTSGNSGLSSPGSELKSSFSATDQVGAEEIATEYFPLAPAQQSFDELQRVRVMLPRSALIQFGLPMNEERASEPITADLLITVDGTPQAIRFIQNVQ
jgi:hypothetical protein